MGAVKKKVIFIGSGYFGEYGFRYLLHDDIQNEIEIVGVITYHYHVRNLSPLIPVAESLFIPVFLGNPNSQECSEWVEKLYPDVCVMMQFPKKLQSNFLKKFQWILNAHPSDLPLLRGGSPIEGTILQNLPLTVTVHLVDHLYDHGPIVHKSLPIPITGMGYEQVAQLAAHQAAPTMAFSIQKMFCDPENLIPQNELLATEFLTKNLDNCLVMSWKKTPVEQLQRQVLAGGKKRGAMTKIFFRNKVYPAAILESRAISCPHNQRIGKTDVLSGDRLKVAAQGGCLIIDAFHSSIHHDIPSLSKEVLFIDSVNDERTSFSN
ncbi:MAG: formyltransferase family protein [Waddliaceae bacterium]